MKKKIIVLSLILTFIVIGIFTLNYKNIINQKNKKRYEQINEDLSEETEKYLKISHPYCSPGSGSFTITEEALLYQWGMDKEKLLDVDKKSYCKARINVTCISENKLKWEINLSCKDYEDDNYSNWDKPKKESKFNDLEKKIIDSIYNKSNIYTYFDTNNLESFEIVELQKLGYYQKEKNIIYIIAKYNSSCKDNTYKCDRLDNNKENKPFSFIIKINTNTFDILEITNNFAAHINSDWVNDYSKIE